MPDPSSERVNCPNCDKGYRWSAKLAGRMVDCKQCAQRFEVPDQPGVGLALAPEPVADDTYELALDQDGRTAADPEPRAVPAVGGKCPACNMKVAETAVICLNCGFNMKEGTRVETAVVAEESSSHQVPDRPETAEAAQRAKSRKEYEAENAQQLARQHRRIELVYPVILLLIGSALCMVIACLIAQFNPGFPANAGFLIIALASLIYLFMQSIGILVAMVIAAALLIMIYGSAFGDLKTALLKAPAIALVLAAVSVGCLMLFENWLESQGVVAAGRQMGIVRMTIRLVAIYSIGYPTLRVLFDLEGLEASIICIVIVVFTFGVSVLGPVLLMGFFA